MGLRGGKNSASAQRQRQRERGGGGGGGDRETDRDRDRQRQSDRNKQTGRQAVRQVGWVGRQRQTYKQTETKTEKNREAET